MKPHRGWEAPINVTTHELQVLREGQATELAVMPDTDRAVYVAIRKRVLDRLVRIFADADTTEPERPKPRDFPPNWAKGSDGLYLRTKPVRAEWTMIDNTWCEIWICAICGNGPIVGDAWDENCCDAPPGDVSSVDSRFGQVRPKDVYPW